MQIRLVQPDELHSLHTFARHTFIEAFAHQNTPENMALYLKDHLTLSSLEQELAHPQSRFFFGEEAGKLIAYSKINAGSAQSEQQLSNALELERIYVHANWQGKGIGAELLMAMTDLAQAEGYDYIWLGVWEENHAAIRFYQRQGFTIFSQHDFYLGNDLQTDIMLKRKL